MPLIHLQLLIGSAAGRRSSFDQNIITFGRGEQSDLTVAESFVSRHHGEIRFENDQWMLHNLSSNGTRVNRKKITTRPQPLKTGDTISVGDRPVIRVGFDLEPSIRPATSPAAKAPGSPRLSGRAKLWIGLGLYVVVIVLFLGVFSAWLARNRSEKAAPPLEFTPARIKAEIILLPERPLDQVRADQALRQATQLYFQREVDPVNIYHTFVAYQRSLAWSGSEDFENPTDVLRFGEVRAQLVKRITDDYQAAVAMLLSGQYRKADQAFAKLTEIYPNQGSPLYKNIQDHRRSAQLNVTRRRRPKGAGFKRR